MSVEHRDLCSTCNHAPTCTSRGTREMPMFFCEEFDAYVPVGAEAPASPVAADNPGPDDDRYKGLCLNCEDRATCTMPKLEGGVWHCEEYR